MAYNEKVHHCLFALLQLISTAALFLAAKSEDTPRPLNDVLRTSSEIFHKQDITFLSYLLPIVSTFGTSSGFSLLRKVEGIKFFNRLKLNLMPLNLFKPVKYCHLWKACPQRWLDCSLEVVMKHIWNKNSCVDAM